MMKVGITGGIGSGKTTACRIFAWLDVPVYYADDRAKWLMRHDPELVRRLRQTFGEEVYRPDQSLNRAYLAQIAFGDAAKREQLNALVHPVVRQDTDRWLQEHADYPYTLREAALFYETGGDKLMDRMIVVTAPVELRIARVMERDGLSRQAVLQRMEAQMPEAEKVKLADFVIHNDAREGLLRQVLSLHRQLLELLV